MEPTPTERELHQLAARAAVLEKKSTTGETTPLVRSASNTGIAFYWGAIVTDQSHPDDMSRK